MARPLVLLIAVTLVAASCGAVAEPTTAVSSQQDPTPAGAEEAPTATSEPSEPAPVVAVDTSPADTVLELVAAANAADPLGMLAVLDPAERELFSRLYVTGLEAAQAQWPHFGGERAFADLEPMLDVEPLTVEMLSDRLAWVSTEAFVIDVGAQTDVTNTFLLGDGAWSVGYDDGRTNRRFDHDFDVHPPGLVVVQLDGRWYVSLARTFAEFRRRNYNLPFVPAPTTVDPAEPADASTPEAAVRGLVEAANAVSWTRARAHLVDAEAAAFGDYEATLAAWVSDVLGQVDYSITTGDLRVIEEQNGRAIVEMTTFDLLISGYWETDDITSDSPDFRMDIDGLCGVLEHEQEIYNGCADAELATDSIILLNLFRDLGWRGPRLVTVEENGEWRVSLYESVLLWTEPLTAEPLFTILSVTSSWPAPWVLMDEASKAVAPIGPGEAGALTPMAAGRVAVGVFPTGDAGATLRFTGPGLSTDSCEVWFWLQDLATQDLYEGPEEFYSEYCDELVDGVELPANATVVVQADAGLYGDPAIPLAGEIMVSHSQ